jgi:hypothetical protein
VHDRDTAVEQGIEAEPVGTAPQPRAAPPGGLDQGAADQLGQRGAVLLGSVGDAHFLGLNAADDMRARRPAIGDQDLVDRGLDGLFGAAVEQIEQLVIGLAKRVV